MAGRVGRSLQLSQQGKQKAQKALTDRCLTQKELAKELDFSRETVSKFFRGLPVDRQYFVKICGELRLEWDEIAAKPTSQAAQEKKQQDSALDIDALVREVQLCIHHKILNDCGKMPLRNQQVTIDNLYTDVYILEDTPNQRVADISQRLRDFDSTADRFESFYLGKVGSQRVPGLDVVKDGCKLMCLGAPGSGKTTYLKYVAIQCDQSQLQANQVPIFIRLIEFAYKARNTPELSLIEYINQLFLTQGVELPQAAQKILQFGRALILLDGLDEVPQADSNSILSFIRDFCQTYHKNSIIITCRTNALEYSFSNLGFTEIIVADFNQQQIDIFANKWFVAVAKNNREIGEARANQFIKKLRMTENQRIRALAVTPILLELTCLVFNDIGDFPANRATLYKWGLNILLKEWNESNRIELDELYQRLSPDAIKELLTHVAVVSFEKSRYFFEEDEVERYIADHLRTLPNTQNDRATLQRNSKALLKSIEAEHGLLVERARGIYSFSHLTFQEYFTAKWFLERTDWKSLISHISDQGWREVFLLSCEMMEPADSLLLLMKRKIDLMLASDDYLQDLFSEIYKKSKLLYELFEIPYKYESFIAYYHDFFWRYAYYNLKLARCLIDYDFEIDYESAFEIMTKLWEIHINYGFSSTALDLSVKLDSHIGNCPMNVIDDFLSEHTDNRRSIKIDKILHDYKIKALLEPINILNHSSKVDELLRIHTQEANERATQLMMIWKHCHKILISDLKSLILNDKKIGFFTHFSEDHKDLLQKYYNANRLLIECLNNSEVTSEVRQEIEDTLLLPFAEIQKRQ